jgi:hypothetical protein
MEKKSYSLTAATDEARAAAEKIRGLLQIGKFDAARDELTKLGKSPQQIKRQRVRRQAPDAMRLKRPVFICGLHRSGTTLLHDYLCAHYDVSYFKSTKVPENEGQFLQNVYMAERPFGGPGSFAFYPQMQFAALTSKTRAEKVAARLLAQWDSWISGTSEILLEKSPPNIVRIPYFRSLFPNARFIIWTRDPRAVSMSTRKWHTLPVSQLMMHWNTAYMKAFADLDADCTLASYEEFCDDPEGTAARLAQFCDLTPRTSPLPLAKRFNEIMNSNAKYIDAFPKRYHIRNQVRAWELFGYTLPSLPPRKRISE